MRALTAQSRYDLVFLCDTDIPFEDTWDRSGAISREIMQKMIIADLRMRRIPFVKLSGSLERRIHLVDMYLDGFNKYDDPLVNYEKVCAWAFPVHRYEHFSLEKART